MDQQAEKDQTERLTEVGRRTKEETAKWNKMTALRFQTMGGHQTSPASLANRLSHYCINKISSDITIMSTRKFV